MQQEALEQGRNSLDRLATLADYQGRADPLSPWHDVGLHAQLAAAHLQLLAAPDGLPAADAHPQPPNDPSATDDPNRLGQALLDRAESLLTSAGATYLADSPPQPASGQDHLRQARLELARARTFLLHTTPGA